MTTSNLPAPTLQTLPVVADDKNLLVTDDSASCCGGSGCCGSN